MGTYSKFVAEGMNRVCRAFTQIVQPLAFKRAKGRKWTRQLDGFEETIFISRNGATYGAPRSPSISLQLDLVSTRASDQRRTDLDHHTIQLTCRPIGYCYHHRFNAETGSTYERCLEELRFFITEVAEPWFAEQRVALIGK